MMIRNSHVSGRHYMALIILAYTKEIHCRVFQMCYVKIGYTQFIIHNSFVSFKVIYMYLFIFFLQI